MFHLQNKFRMGGKSQRESLRFFFQECQVRPKLATSQTVDTRQLFARTRLPADWYQSDHAAARDVANIASVWPHSWRGSIMLTTHGPASISELCRDHLLQHDHCSPLPKPSTLNHECIWEPLEGFWVWPSFFSPRVFHFTPFHLNPSQTFILDRGLLLLLDQAVTYCPRSTLSSSSSSRDESAANKNISTSLNSSVYHLSFLNITQSWDLHELQHTHWMTAANGSQIKPALWALAVMQLSYVIYKTSWAQQFFLVTSL